ncbi:MAG: NADH-quinone oxidoreductase subunit NuoN [Hyphomicrobiaceae bacterium]
MQISHILPFSALAPELVIVVGAMALLMLGVFSRRDMAETITWLAMAVLGVAAVLLIRQHGAPQSVFSGAFVVDGFGRFVKLVVVLSTIGALVLSLDYFRQTRGGVFEYPVLVLLSVAGMMMMVSAGNLIALYLGLELQSLALYVLAAIRRDSLRSSEAGLKYFVLGALSSGMLLYGASLIYGFTGSTAFVDIAAAAKTGGHNIGLVFGLVFLLVGLAFKISAVPFHMWTPDVYEGAPTPVAAFFSVAPKVAAMALFMRVVMTAFPSVAPQWQQIVFFLSVASMLLGAFAAIGQTNIKRLMAYSSIGHMGYALVGLATASREGVTGVLLYLAVYVVMSLGAFACILAMRRNDGMVEEIDELAGLSRTNLPLAFMLAMLMFSLAGIPPLAGFFAKFYIFIAAVKVGFYPLAVLGVLTSVVGAYYYLRIIKIMFFDEPKEPFEPVPAKVSMVVGVTGAFVLLFALIVSPLLSAATSAARSLL